MAGAPSFYREENMATPITTPDMDAAIVNAGNALAAAMNGKSDPGNPPAASAPAPSTPPPAAPVAAPPSTPTPAPVATPAASPAPAAPVPGTPVAPTPQDLASSISDPNAKYYLSLHGNDPAKALAKAAADNNRLAALAKAHPELFAPGAVADPKAAPAAPPTVAPLFQDPGAPATPGATPTPAATPTPPAGPAAAAGATPAVAPPPTPPEVVLDWAKISEDTQATALRDETSRNFVQGWVQADQAQRAAQGEIEKITSQLSYIDQKLKDESLTLTEADREDIKDQIRSLRFDLSIARNEKQTASSEATRLEANWNVRQREIYDYIAAQHHSHAQEEALTRELEADTATAFNELSTAWPAAISRVATASSIPADQLEDFKAEAKLALQARWASDPNFVLDTNAIDAFVTPVAQAFMARMDRYHRSQSAIYAQQAAQRAAAPSPPPPAGTPGAPPVSEPKSLEDIMANAQHEVRQVYRGGGYRR